MPSADYSIDACDHEDFRGANRDQQRWTNHTQKWGRDREPACADCYHDSEECQKAVPLGTYMRGVNLAKMTKTLRPPRLDTSNFNKLNRVTGWTKPVRRQHTTTDALAEVQIANTMTSSFIVSSSYTPVTSTAPISDAPLGSELDAPLDDGAAPLRSLPLAAFVKEPSVKDTERMVNREYEIVDSNGSTATGRRARELLRQSPTSSAVPTTDGDFELI
ncbi:hypothetical protein SBRCBS47491_000724 [Sporothrix bragantina]|uniref:Integral membrane protein n=1 Tax=Sporothrix bragantina TaxID=671064 RepID=A0ABP0ASP3_9PEZI